MLFTAATRKHVLSSLFLLLAWLGCLGGPRLALAQLAIFNSSPSAKPGEAVSLQGNFSAAASIYLQSPAGTQQLTPLARGTGQATVQVPPTLALGTYQLWVQENGQRSPAVAVNQARGMHFDTPEVAPGSRFRLFGRNLQLPGATTQVRIGAYAATTDAAASDAYSLAIIAPGTLPAGTYDVFVNNGGGEVKAELPLRAIAAGPDFFGIGLPWATKFTSAITTNVYNVQTDPRLKGRWATGNGTDEDGPAIQAAIDAAARDGGGTVFLPAGRYRLFGTGFILTIRSRVVLRGAGRDQTTIVLSGEAPLQTWAFHFDDNANLAGMCDLGYVNEADQTFDHPKGNLLGTGTELFIRNCRFTLNESTWLELPGCDKLAFLDNIVTQGANQAAGGHGPLRLDNSTNYYVGRNSITFGVDGLNFNSTRAGVFENNTIVRDGSAQYPQGNVNHVLVVNFAENLACLGNNFSVSNRAALSSQATHDGETIIAEGGGASPPFESVGTVAAAAASSVVVDRYWQNPAADVTQAIVAIVRGKGMGQWRRVASRAGNVLTLSQPWAVVPDASSSYATFAWGARNWLVQRNTMTDNPRGITLYFNATADIAIVGNSLTNNGSIDLTPYQRQAWDGGPTVGFCPVYNAQVVGNRVDCSGDARSGAFIGVHSVQHITTSTFGTSVIGLEMRGNTLLARTPNVPAVVDDQYPNGYLNYLEFHETTARYNDQQVPAVLGSILQDNTAINCDRAVYLNSGSYNTLLCSTTVAGPGTLLQDQAFTGLAHASVGTSTACQGQSASALRAPENPSGTAAGLSYQYYEGQWSALPDLASLTPVASGSVASLSLAPAQRSTNYAMRFTGYLTVPADGLYTFSTVSDDGSRFYIGTTLVVDNDGLHAAQERTGTIGLQAGVHAITVDFLQGEGDQNLLLSYQSPALAKQLVPVAAYSQLASALPTATALRVNAGGPGLPTTRGYFAADQYCPDGEFGSTLLPVAGTADMALYQTERIAENFAYHLPVPNGQYTVVLHFAELYWPSPGKRVFDVAVEGETRLHNYDIARKVGTRVATSETLAVTVADGSLDLEFAATINLAKVSAIEVLSNSPALGAATSARAGLQPEQVLADQTATAPTDALRAYPNPSQGTFTVAYSAPAAQPATLLLLDALGRVVQQRAVVLEAGAHELPFRVAGPALAAGLYELRLVGRDGWHQTQQVSITP